MKAFNSRELLNLVGCRIIRGIFNVWSKITAEEQLLCFYGLHMSHLETLRIQYIISILPGIHYIAARLNHSIRQGGHRPHCVVLLSFSNSFSYT